MDRYHEIGLIRSAMIAAIVTLSGLAMMSCDGSSPLDPLVNGSGDLEFDENDKTPICHYQKDLGTWTLTMLSLEAALEHLSKHDDAVPGGITSITRTPLDSQCKRRQ